MHGPLSEHASVAESYFGAVSGDVYLSASLQASRGAHIICQYRTWVALSVAMHGDCIGGGVGGVLAQTSGSARRSGWSVLRPRSLALVSLIKVKAVQKHIRLE